MSYTISRQKIKLGGAREERGQRTLSLVACSVSLSTKTFPDTFVISDYCVELSSVAEKPFGGARVFLLLSVTRTLYKTLAPCKRRRSGMCGSQQAPKFWDLGEKWVREEGRSCSAFSTTAYSALTARVTANVSKTPV